MSGDDSGEYEDSAHTAGVAISYTSAPMSGAEVDYHRKIFGETYRERHGRDSAKCIALCRTPDDRRSARCPSCYGPVAVRSFNDMTDIPPEPGRGERLAAWIGRFAAELAHGFMFPFQASRRHQEAIIRDILQDAIGEGLPVDIYLTCPRCKNEDQADAGESPGNVTGTAGMTPPAIPGSAPPPESETLSEANDAVNGAN